MQTVKTEADLDALPVGQKLRFTVSGATLEKTIADLWLVHNVKGCWTAEDICRNGTPMELID